jgi:hypothetical protein
VKEGGEKKGSARGSVHWSGYDTTTLDIEKRCLHGVCVCVCLLLQDLVER